MRHFVGLAFIIMAYTSYGLQEVECGCSGKREWRRVVSKGCDGGVPPLADCNVAECALKVHGYIGHN